MSKSGAELPAWAPRKGYVPVRYWVAWWSILGLAVVVFYVLLTPIWIGLRLAAWAAELRARASGSSGAS